MWHANPKRVQRGFTLLEVLVALAVFAVISAVAYAGLNQINHSKARLDQEIRLWRELALVMDRMESDLWQSLPNTLMYSVPPASAAEKWRLNLIRFDSRQQSLRVSYQWRDEKLELVLWHGEEMRIHPLFSGVREAKLSFLGESGQWAEKPDKTRQRGVRLQLDLAGQGRFERLFILP